MSKVIDEYAVPPVGRIRAVTADTPGRAGIEAVRGRRSNRVGGPIDLDALIDHVESLPQPSTAVIEGRITRLN